MNPDDPYDLSRFLTAQDGVYERAPAELKDGQKRTHWMWFNFPQIEGLGYSPTAKRYPIKSIEEARQYLSHPVLGKRLEEYAEALLALRGGSVSEIDIATTQYQGVCYFALFLVAVSHEVCYILNNHWEKGKLSQ